MYTHSFLYVRACVYLCTVCMHICMHAFINVYCIYVCVHIYDESTGTEAPLITTFRYPTTQASGRRDPWREKPGGSCGRQPLRRPHKERPKTPLTSPPSSPQCLPPCLRLSKKEGKRERKKDQSVFSACLKDRPSLPMLTTAAHRPFNHPPTSARFICLRPPANLPTAARAPSSFM